MKMIEHMQICEGFKPVDMQTAANTGDYVNLKGYDHCMIVFFKAIGTAGDDPTITVTQAQDVAGTGVKALNFTRVDKKQGADLTAIGQFTKVTQAEGNTFTHTDLAEQAAIIVIEFDASELDADGGFTCLKAAVADVGGNAQLGCLFYQLFDARYKEQPMPSAIA
jgi:hypothetical protein